MRAASGSLSKVSERASSARWSPARSGEMRIAVRPGPDQPLARRLEVLEQAGNRVAVGIAPAADGEHRAFDRIPVLAHRAVPPVGVSALVPEPGLQEQRQVLQAV